MKVDDILPDLEINLPTYCRLEFDRSQSGFQENLTDKLDRSTGVSAKYFGNNIKKTFGDYYAHKKNYKSNIIWASTSSARACILETEI